MAKTKTFPSANTAGENLLVPEFFPTMKPVYEETIVSKSSKFKLKTIYQYGGLGVVFMYKNLLNVSKYGNADTYINLTGQRSTVSYRIMIKNWLSPSSI